MREKKEGEEWVVEGTRALHVVEGEGGIKISLGGYMSDERNMFLDGTFKVRNGKEKRGEERRALTPFRLAFSLSLRGSR